MPRDDISNFKKFQVIVRHIPIIFSPCIASTFVHAVCERSARVCAELRHPARFRERAASIGIPLHKASPRGWRARVRLCVAFNGRWRKLRLFTHDYAANRAAISSSMLRDKVPIVTSTRLNNYDKSNPSINRISLHFREKRFCHVIEYSLSNFLFGNDAVNATKIFPNLLNDIESIDKKQNLRWRKWAIKYFYV